MAFARATPCRTAISDGAEPSVGIRTCLYMTFSSLRPVTWPREVIRTFLSPFVLERLGANARPACLADQIPCPTDADDASMRSRRFRRRHEIASLTRSRGNREDRARRKPHHALGRATQERVADVRVPVSAEDDEADALVLRVADDLMRYAARQAGGFQRAACC